MINEKSNRMLTTEASNYFSREFDAPRAWRALNGSVLSDERGSIPDGTYHVLLGIYIIYIFTHASHRLSTRVPRWHHRVIVASTTKARVVDYSLLRWKETWTEKQCRMLSVMSNSILNIYSRSGRKRKSLIGYSGWSPVKVVAKI